MIFNSTDIRTIDTELKLGIILKSIKSIKSIRSVKSGWQNTGDIRVAMYDYCNQKRIPVIKESSFHRCLRELVSRGILGVERRSGVKGGIKTKWFCLIENDEVNGCHTEKND